MRKLKRIIEEHYFKNDQMLSVVNCYMSLHDLASIYLSDKDEGMGKYLFSIYNLQSSFGVDLMPSHFKETREIPMNEVVEYSNQPLYMNQLFTLKKFEKITEEDILNCTKYFVNEVLDIFLIFNIKFINEIEEKI